MLYHKCFENVTIVFITWFDNTFYIYSLLIAHFYWTVYATYVSCTVLSSAVQNFIYNSYLRHGNRLWMELSWAGSDCHKGNRIKMRVKCRFIVQFPLHASPRNDLITVEYNFCIFYSLRLARQIYDSQEIIYYIFVQCYSYFNFNSVICVGKIFYLIV